MYEKLESIYIPGLTEEEFKNSEIYKLLMRDIEKKFPDKIV